MEQIIVTKVNGTTFPLQSKANSSTILSAKQTVELLNQDIIDISVQSGKKIKFEIGDKITVLGRDYTQNTPAKEVKVAENLYNYDIQYEGVQYDLGRASYDINLDTTGVDIQGDSLTGNMKTFLDILIQNTNRLFPGKWVLGTYPAETETITETFGDSDNCLSVLQTLCQKYNTEFDIVIASNGTRTLNIGQAGSTFAFTFRYGKGKGIFNLTREKVTSSNIVNRLKVYGSNKNLSSKYRSSRLLLPGKTKAQSYIEAAASIAKYGVWENAKIFEDIYPSRVGTVSALGVDRFTFVDSSMNFDLNEKEADGVTTKYLLSGVAAKIHFNTGNLAGYEFDIHSYNHASKTFVIVEQTDERDMTFPSPTSAAFQIAVGDKYVILDIALPQAYIDTAETKLQTEGAAYLEQNAQPKVQYSLTVDEFFLKNIVGAEVETNIFWVGDYIPIQDSDIEVDKLIRIKTFTRDLLKGYRYELTIADLSVTRSIYSRVISELRDIDKTIVINNLRDPARARRNYLSAQELLNKVFDTEGDYYSDRIKPLSIETSMLSVGAKSMQFGLDETVFQPNYAGVKNRIVYKGGTLVHYAIIDGSNNPRTWNITDGDVTLASDAAYYVYAKCQKSGSGGVMLFTTDKIAVDQDATYYHFLVGIANSVDATTNTRALALMYGFTTVNGKHIKTGRITSSDGSTYFDLDTGIFSGKFSFSAGSSGLTNLSEWAAAAQDIETAQSTANQAVQSAASLQSFIDNTLPAELSSLQAQIDGKVESWYYDYSPTLANYPAIEWITDVLKDRHIGDTFTNTQEFVDASTTPDAGKSWRFVKNGSVYSWTPIADSDAVKALLAASKAQDTADGKRRVFVTQPTTPYEVGDLWTQGSAGDIMRCINQRLSGAYVAGDWEKAVKYTDDTAVQNLQIGGKNLLLNSAQEKYGYEYLAYENLSYIFDQNGIGKYVISFEAKCTIAGTALVYPSPNEIAFFKYIFPHTYFNITTNYVRYKIPVVVTLNNPAAVDTVIAFYTGNWNGGYISVRNIKVETGDKATDWTPAPEDIDAKIQDQQIYVEYSIDGSTSWHATFTTGDLYMRQKKGSGAWSAAIRIVGEKGDAGNEGRYTDYQFAKNTSATTAPTSGWQDAPPAITAGEYVWMRVGEVIPPATSPASWSAAVRITGDKGDTGPQGVAGTPGADGLTTYTWIKYADDSSGSGISNDPTGKTYIGFAYNKTTAVESNNPADYSWSLIKGEQGNQGVQGPPGANGVTTYTWIKYSDNADGTGLYDTPTANTKYIGIAVNKTTASESSEKTDYVWSLFKGADGKSVTATDVEFAQSASATTAPSSGWQTTAPAWIDGQYIWTRTKTTYSEGSPSYSAAVNLTGAKGTTGNTGSTGTGVDSITEEYYLSTSKTEQTGGAWSTTPPTWSSGKYVWTRVKIVYKNPASTVYTTPVVSSEWEAVNEIRIGGRNLLPNSEIEKTGFEYLQYIDPTTLFDQHGVGEFMLSFEIKVSVAGTVLLYSTPGEYSSFKYVFASVGIEATTNYVRHKFLINIGLNNPSSVNSSISFYSGSWNGGYIYIKNVKIERGNKATDWTPAPEDTQAAIDEAKNKALELEYLKTALAGSTDIQGGLLASNVILMKTLAGAIVGGMSGLANDNIGFWTGGTYAQAIANLAKIIMRKDGSGQLAGGKILFDALGALLVGNFNIEGGSIVGYADNKDKVKFHTGAIQTLESLSGGAWVEAPERYHIGVIYEEWLNESGGPEPLELSWHASGYLTVPPNTGVKLNPATISADLVGNYANKVALQEYHIYKNGSLVGSYTPSTTNVVTLTAGGQYYIEFHYFLNFTNISGTVALTLTQTVDAVITYQLGAEKTEIGKDGFFSYWSNLLYIHFSQAGGLKLKGPTDINGVLASASVAASGASTSKSGAKVGDSSKNSTGVYTIQHSIGHTNYKVFINVKQYGRYAWETAKGTSSLTINIRDGANALYDQAFDYVLIGDN